MTEFKENPTVIPVKELPPDPRIKPTHPNFFQPPELCLAIGAVKSGKTTLINSIFFQPREDGFFGQEYFDDVHIISNTIGNDPTARFLKKAFNVSDYYTDGQILDLIKQQDSYGAKEDMPFIALVLDDILGTNMKRNNEISFLATRFRHKNIGFMMVSAQNFKSVDTILRNNATSVVIFRQTNNKQLEQCAEEYCSMFGSKEKFYEIYKKAVEKKFDFLYLKVYEGKALRSFEELLWDVDTDLKIDEIELPTDEVKKPNKNIEVVKDV
jgi:hypothetical protein